MKVIIFDLDDTILDTTGTIVAPDYSLTNIKLVSGANEVLSLPDVKNILVSFGEEERQKEKIRILGIASYFSEIYVTRNNDDKFEVFKSLSERFSEFAPGMFVVGNRVDAEIRFGNLCGMTTVLLRHGKHQVIVPKEKAEHPTYTINSLFELPKIVLSK